MASRLLKGTRLRTRQVREIVRLFCLEVPARKAAVDLGVHRHTVERLYRELRHRIVLQCEREAGTLDGEVEVDESYFGGRRKGLRGRSVQGKSVVFGILKRQGWVYTRQVGDVTGRTLKGIIGEKVPPGATVYSDQFRSYDGLVTDGYEHYRIRHDREFARGRRNHINGLENFWSFAKGKLLRYRGIQRSVFSTYLKEMEYRFNHRNEPLVPLVEALLMNKDLA